MSPQQQNRLASPTRQTRTGSKQSAATTLSHGRSTSNSRKRINLLATMKDESAAAAAARSTRGVVSDVTASAAALRHAGPGDPNRGQGSAVSTAQGTPTGSIIAAPASSNSGPSAGSTNRSVNLRDLPAGVLQQLDKMQQHHAASAAEAHKQQFVAMAAAMAAQQQTSTQPPSGAGTDSMTSAGPSILSGVTQMGSPQASSTAGAAASSGAVAHGSPPYSTAAAGSMGEAREQLRTRSATQVMTPHSASSLAGTPVHQAPGTAAFAIGTRYAVPFSPSCTTTVAGTEIRMAAPNARRLPRHSATSGDLTSMPLSEDLYMSPGVSRPSQGAYLGSREEYAVRLAYSGGCSGALPSTQSPATSDGNITSGTASPTKPLSDNARAVQPQVSSISLTAAAFASTSPPTIRFAQQALSDEVGLVAATLAAQRSYSPARMQQQQQPQQQYLMPPQQSQQFSLPATQGLVSDPQVNSRRETHSSGASSSSHLPVTSSYLPAAAPVGLQGSLSQSAGTSGGTPSAVMSMPYAREATVQCARSSSPVSRGVVGSRVSASGLGLGPAGAGTPPSDMALSGPALTALQYHIQSSPMVQQLAALVQAQSQEIGELRSSMANMVAMMAGSQKLQAATQNGPTGQDGPLVATPAASESSQTLLLQGQVAKLTSAVAKLQRKVHEQEVVAPVTGPSGSASSSSTAPALIAEKVETAEIAALGQAQHATMSALEQLAKGMEALSGALHATVMMQDGMQASMHGATHLRDKDRMVTKPGVYSSTGGSSIGSSIASSSMGADCTTQASQASLSASASSSMRSTIAEVGMERQAVCRQLARLQADMRQLQILLTSQRRAAARSSDPGDTSDPSSANGSAIAAGSGGSGQGALLGSLMQQQRLAVERLQAHRSSTDGASGSDPTTNDTSKNNNREVVPGSLTLEAVWSRLQALAADMRELRQGEVLALQAQETLADLLDDVRNELSSLRAAVTSSPAVAAAAAASTSPSGTGSATDASSGSALAGRNGGAGLSGGAAAGVAARVAAQEAQIRELCGAVARVNALLSGSLTHALARIGAQSEDIEVLKVSLGQLQTQAAGQFNMQHSAE